MNPDVVWTEVTLLKCVLLFLYLSGCLCQRDCTGVDCPLLNNCIEEVLESGACCATCVQTGCTCEGYQYYDCVNAGFKNGKVPEGDSYFVDYGSTECSCPEGGGRISCHFISCPDIPPNCIEVSEPADGCVQCERIGCVHDGQKYEAGHSFHIDPCRVCHCPTEGGKLMCYPVPNCDPRKVHKPMLASSTEDSATNRHYSDLHKFDHQGPVDRFSTPHRLSSSGSIPLFKPPLDKEEMEEYDYDATDVRESYPDSLVFPTQAYPTNKVISVSRGADRADRASTRHSLDRETKQELRERYGVHVHPTDREEVTESPVTAVQSTVKTTVQEDTTTAWWRSSSEGVMHAQSGSQSHISPHTGLESAMHAASSSDSVIFPRNRGSGSEKHPVYPHRSSATQQSRPVSKTHRQNVSDSVILPLHPLRGSESHIVAQKQCCLSSLKDSQCLSGMTSARRGDVCDVEAEGQCADDSYQVCCSCCALGLRMRSEGRGCNAHQYLGFPCGHVFLTCCEEQEGLDQLPLKRKERPRPTAMPRKVSDSKFPKEAFSIQATDEAANAVEEQEDVNECQLYRGQLCQHTCTNTWGSYRCGCHPGYILQPDGHSCAPGESHCRASTGYANMHAFHSQPSDLKGYFGNFCMRNGPCSQQCTVVVGQARCSCFPGFSLMADGQTCEDVDECVTNTHSCRPSERCVNTVGSFVCERQVTCPAGYQPRNGVCEDIDECMVRTHNCGVGSVCENTEGSFLCNPKQKCLTGFTQDSHGNCIDINECTSLSEPCSPGFNCINTVGSYTCQRKVIMCTKGYHSSSDGAKCVDIDECQTGTHRCGVGQICHNLPGSYRCDCQTGYQYDALRQVCTDVNECWRYPGRLCSQTCENTPGSYHCSCTAGFSLAFDGKNCEDVNECDNNPCSQECANIYGSYQCYCRQGFYLKEDGHTCEDIDECAQSIGNLCAFQCVNVAGSYQCACPPHGYTMSANGRTCRDIDECTTGTHNCSSGQNCYNIQGGFRCLSFDCPANYKKVSDIRCERLSCPSNSLDCQNSPLRITYYQLSFQTNIVIPAQIFRIGPSPAYSGDHIVISITKGNEEGYFTTRKLNSFTGAVYLQRQVREPKDFLIDVEMRLLRQGTFTTFLARIYVFITATSM
uniref:Fibulin 2 n=1 Tax=Myripristis murdjan TaxID=586833 RepID=A0A668A591_9TELE